MTDRRYLPGFAASKVNAYLLSDAGEKNETCRGLAMTEPFLLYTIGEMNLTTVETDDIEIVELGRKKVD